MTVSIMKSSFQKIKPSIITYCDYKYFNNYNFREDLVYFLSYTNLNVSNPLEKLLSICREVLDKHAPLKKTFVRGNHSPFINKDLSKAIMTRSRFRNKYIKFPSKN